MTGAFYSKAQDGSALGTVVMTSFLWSSWMLKQGSMSRLEIFLFFLPDR